MNAASSASDAFAEKSSTETYSPLGMTTMCVGACGLMSRKASTCSSSYTFAQGSSPRRMRAKTLLRSYAKPLSFVFAAALEPPRLQRGVAVGNREAAVIALRVVHVVVERQYRRSQALPDVPVVVIARPGPCRRGRQPGIVGQLQAFHISANGAGPVDPDAIRRRTAPGRRQPRADAAEILLDRSEDVALRRVVIDRKIDCAAVRLADRAGLLIGHDRVGVAPLIGEMLRPVGLVLPDGDQLHAGSRDGSGLVGRQGRQARQRTAIIPGDEMQPAALQLLHHVAAVQRHVDAAGPSADRRCGNRPRLR